LSEIVGWVEARSADTHRFEVMGIANNPFYSESQTSKQRGLGPLETEQPSAPSRGCSISSFRLYRHPGENRGSSRDFYPVRQSFA